MLELNNRKWLGEHVCRIICCTYLLYSEVSCYNNVSDIMVLDADMLGFGVIGITLGEMNNTLTI